MKNMRAWALTLILHRTQCVADEAINRALDGSLVPPALWALEVAISGVEADENIGVDEDRWRASCYIATEDAA
jgi:hypothetical protein